MEEKYKVKISGSLVVCANDLGEGLRLWKEIVREEHANLCTDRSESIEYCSGGCRKVELWTDAEFSIYNPGGHTFIARGECAQAAVEKGLQDDVLKFAFS